MSLSSNTRSSACRIPPGSATTPRPDRSFRFALAAAKANRNDLSGLGVVAEPGGIRHADDLVFDERLIDLERLGDDRTQFVGVRSISDDHELAVDEAIRAGRV